jgi:hypothetical protein
MVKRRSHRVNQARAAQAGDRVWALDEDATSFPWPYTFEQRREALEEFLDYAASLPDVRITTFKEVVDFLRAPRPLSCYRCSLVSAPTRR